MILLLSLVESPEVAVRKRVTTHQHFSASGHSLQSFLSPFRLDPVGMNITPSALAANTSSRFQLKLQPFMYLPPLFHPTGSIRLAVSSETSFFLIGKDIKVSIWNSLRSLRRMGSHQLRLSATLLYVPSSVRVDNDTGFKCSAGNPYKVTCQWESFCSTSNTDLCPDFCSLCLDSL